MNCFSMATFDAVSDDGDTIDADAKGFALLNKFVPMRRPPLATNRDRTAGTWQRSGGSSFDAAR
jgi:hypothetical protein